MPAVLRVGMVDDHPSPVWGIERILDRQSDMDLVCSASTVSGLFEQGIQTDIVILDLRLDDGTTPGQ
ncbi:response regulator transcription factor, partial [Streptomyces sp. SID10244]|nr:response regulator transcription factor [Streptomyces sp. SID10244]